MNLDLRSPRCLHRIITTYQRTQFGPILPRFIPLAMLRALQCQPMDLRTPPRLLPLATPLYRLPFLPLTLSPPSSAFSLPLAPDVGSYRGVVYALRGGVLDQATDESINDEYHDHKDKAWATCWGPGIFRGCLWDDDGSAVMQSNDDIIFIAWTARSWDQGVPLRAIYTAIRRWWARWWLVLYLWMWSGKGILGRGRRPPLLLCHRRCGCRWMSEARLRVRLKEAALVGTPIRASNISASALTQLSQSTSSTNLSRLPIPRF